MKLNNVRIKNFKSLLDIDIELSNLTLITGVNSSGKSSFIQSLLIIKENMRDIIINNQIFSNMDTRLQTNEYSKLIDKKSLLNQNSTDENIIFTVNGDSDANDEADTINEYLTLTIDRDFKYEVNYNFSITRSLELLFENSFYYLHTDRVSPSANFGFSINDIENNSIGINGEFTVHYLDENRRKELNIQHLKHKNSQTNQLLENVSKWLGDISGGVSIFPEANPIREQADLFYQYEYNNGDTSSKYHASNVGFGLTYVLPVITLVLKSHPGDFVIIENPESHLHPKGQSKLAELCAIAAENGVQMIIESHSDHFLNGLRVATKNKIIQPQHSQIYFFHKDKGKLDTIATPINIDDNGRLSDWPKSFFDEWDNQLDKLLW